jgi:hypothetical protein
VLHLKVIEVKDYYFYFAAHRKERTMNKTYIVDNSFAKVVSGEWSFEDWMAQAENGPDIDIQLIEDEEDSAQEEKE